MENIPYLPSFDASKMQSFLNNQFFNPNVHEELAKILNPLGVSFNDRGKENNFKLRRYVTFQKVLRYYNKYNDSYSVITGIKNVNDLFLITQLIPTKRKITYGPVANAKGWKFSIDCNELKAKIPNFLYIYGFMRQSELKVNNDKVVGWDRNDNKDPNLFIFSEYPGVPLEKFLLNCKKDQIFSIILQAFLAFESLFSTKEKRTPRIGNFYVKSFSNPLYIKYDGFDRLIETKDVLMITPFNGKPSEGEVPRNKRIRNHFYTMKIIIMMDRLVEDPEGRLSLANFLREFPLVDVREEDSKYQILGEFKSKILPYVNDKLVVHHPYTRCESIPCLTEKDLVRIAPSDLAFNDIIDLFEYIEAGGVVNKDDIGNGKRIDIRRLVGNYKDDVLKTGKEIRNGLLNIQIPIYQIITSDPTISSDPEELKEASDLLFLQGLGAAHANFTILKNKYELLEEYLPLVMNVTNMFSYDINQTGSEVSRELGELKERIEWMDQQFKNAADAYKNMGVYSDYIDKAPWAERFVIGEDDD